MNIKFLNAKRVSDNSVSAAYTLDGTEFTVEWNNVNPGTGEIETYDLQLDTKSIDCDLAIRVDEAIREGETDTSPDIDLYLYIRDTFNSSDCEQEGFTLSDFEFEYREEVDGTYVVSVSVDFKNFEVNCQNGTTYNYKVSKSVSCINESGGDYTDSGLAAFVENNCAWLSEEIQSLIDECAKPHSEQTTEEYLEGLTDISLKRNSGDGVFGACFANNCSFSRYDEIDGERIVITAEDSGENIPQKIIGEDYIIFENKNEYVEWYDLHQEQDQYASISAAYRAYKSMNQEEDC